jgi:toxin YoeB
LSWLFQDKKIIKRINAILLDIKQNDNVGIRKPEQLKYKWFGFWSRRIDNINRLIYRLEEKSTIIAQGKGHYDD